MNNNSLNIRSRQTFVRRISEHISQVVENFFYTLGFSISRQPKRWILLSIFPVFICLIGFSRFRQEKNPLRLWVPPDSDFVHDTEWLMSSFGEGQRIQTVILTGNNVLRPQALLKLINITEYVMDNQKKDIYRVSWNDVCFKVPVISTFNLTSRKIRDTNVFDDDFFDEEPVMKTDELNFDPGIHVPVNVYCKILNSFPRECLLFSILDIWHYNVSLINQLTENDIIEDINTVTVSPTLGHTLNYIDLLGGITKDDQGRIISARAVKTQWIVHVNFSKVNMDKIGNEAGTADWATKEVLEWESLFLNNLKECSKDLERNKSTDKSLSLFYEAGRSFGDVSSSTLFQDVDKLIIGVILMAFYVQVILSNFNWIEWRFGLTAFALLCVASAFVVAVGACSLLGIPYGPVHTSLPFLLMGLGVDDTFIMFASWEQVLINEKNRMKSLEEKVALMLRHAGAAICITSLTDVVAFIIGASTILPSLQSFCIYAAIGVLITFILQVTLFVAVFTLDVRRIRDKRNCMVPCIIHENFKEKLIKNKRPISWKFIDYVYSNIVFTTLGKVVVVTMTIILTLIGSFGCYHLEQWFDPVWFLPKNSYLNNYILVHRREFPQRGFPGSVFLADVNYTTEFTKILNLSESLKEITYVESVNSWPRGFVDFLLTNYRRDIMRESLKENEFYYFLSKFLFSRSGGKYQRNFRFDGNLTCSQKTPRILVSSIDFMFSRLSSPYQWIPAMDETKSLARNAGINGFVTVWSKMFGTWVTDKVIAQEVMRNLLLALVCVMSTTAVLIAEIQTCFWILVCVLLTLLDVCGFMYFWGFTIDIVSCIGLELAVGLSVDYAAHVAHAFLNAKSSDGKLMDRQNRALTAVRHVGAAVIFGAGSTLLALSLLILSSAYVFQTFFKIFFMVIVFGLWHGILLLPVVLSIIGPKSLKTCTLRPPQELESLPNTVSAINNQENDSQDKE